MMKGAQRASPTGPTNAITNSSKGLSMLFFLNAICVKKVFEYLDMEKPSTYVPPGLHDKPAGSYFNLHNLRRVLNTAQPIICKGL